MPLSNIHGWGITFMDISSLPFMIRRLQTKCYRIVKRFYLCQTKTHCYGFLVQIPRGAPRLWRGAEITPVEPDQGNACAGKEATFISPLFVTQHFRFNL